MGNKTLLTGAVLSVVLTVGAETASAQSPYRSLSIPGRIEAEDFDNGVQDESYRDDDSGNNGGDYRSTNVDIEGASEGGYNVGWIGAGEWLEYAVNIAAGTYDIDARVAGYGGTFHIEFDGSDRTGTFTVPNMGNWQAWTTVRKSAVSLPGGMVTMRVYFDSPGFNLNYLNFISRSSSSQTAYRAFSVPGRIQAEDFDNGGAGVAFYDADAGNNGGAYRSTNVDLEACAEGGTNVGWIADGEWLEYTVNVPAGTYAVDARVAGYGGALRVEFNGANLTGTMNLPNTGNWQAWTTVRRSGVSLAAGTYVMRVFVERGGFNLNYIDLVSAPSAVTTTTTSTTTTTTQPAASGGSIRVVSFNTHHVEAGASAVAAFVLGYNPDVVILQEVSDWAVADIRTQFNSRSGVTWQSRYDYGVMMLTKLPVNSMDSRSIGDNSWGDYRSAIRAEVRVGSTAVNVFGTHLDIARDWSGGYVSQNMSNLLSWASNFSGRKIIAGDLNAVHDSPDPLQYDAIRQIRSAGYVDACVQVKGSDAACGATLDNGWKPDAIYRSSGLRATGFTVTPTSLSDHHLLLGVINIE